MGLAMIKIVHWLLLSIYMAFSSLQGQDAMPQTKEATPPFPFPEEEVRGDEGHFASQLLQMLLMLGLLLGLLLFTSWFLKRMMNTRIQQVNGNSAIKVLEQRAVSTRTTVYALDIEGKTYIFAETPSAVTPLYPIQETNQA